MPQFSKMIHFLLQTFSLSTTTTTCGFTSYGIQMCSEDEVCNSSGICAQFSAFKGQCRPLFTQSSVACPFPSNNQPQSDPTYGQRCGYINKQYLNCQQSIPYCILDQVQSGGNLVGTCQSEEYRSDPQCASRLSSSSVAGCI
eukprot:NODE_458_length_7216_cov_0.728537.p5 type:complete len:142 gc:universal NODE_458_length_7216_cov_0.728537:1872-1447(-)